MPAVPNPVLSPASYAQGARPRVLIVDDSAVARAALARVIGESARFTVAATAPTAEIALDVLRQETVDFILLDLELPGTNGIVALPSLLAAGKGAKILVVSGSVATGAAATVEALALGAADTLEKPLAGGIAGRFGETLLAKLDAIATPAHDVRSAPRIAPRPARRFDAIAIGASTGGIHALSVVLDAIPAEMRQPIFVTQHLPESFSTYFAAQVATAARRPCAVAADRTRIMPGAVLVAPGDAHLVAVPLPEHAAAARLSREPAPTTNMPSVDPMLSSLAAIYRDRLLAIVLTGMGRDGLIGARAVRAAGGTILVQDRETSVVWGMPGAIAGEGLAHAVLTPRQIGAYIAANGVGA